MKSNVLKSSLVILLASSTSAFATTGTITFQGAVVDSTCKASVNGGSNNTTVALDNVEASKFASVDQTPVQIAIGENPREHLGVNFEIILSNCSPNTVKPYFIYETDKVNEQGLLLNTSTSTKKSEFVGIELSTGSSDINISQGVNQAKATGSGTYTYTAKYVRLKEGTVQAGEVLGSVTYGITYQ